MSLYTGYTEKPPILISSLTNIYGVGNEGMLSAGATAASYETTAKMIFQPIYLPFGCVVKRMYYAHSGFSTGTFAGGSDNLELCIYSSDTTGTPLNRIVSTGLQWAGSGRRLVFYKVPYTVLTPNLYYIAFTVGNSFTVLRATLPGVGHANMMKWEQSSVNPGASPDAATPSKATSPNMYLIGFSTVDGFD